MKRKTQVQLCVVALLVALAIVCTGCSGSGNAYKLYQSATEKFNATDEIDMSMAYTLNLEMGEYSSETKMKADVMGVDLNSNPVYLLYYDTTVFGTTVNTEVYYADNVAYVDTGDRRYKQTLSFDELMEEHGGPVLQMDDLKQFMNLTEEDFAAATSVSEGGITKISVTLSGDEFKNVIAQSLQGTMASSGSFGLYSENISASDLIMTFSLNQDQHFTGMTLDTDITLNMNSGASLYSRTAAGGDENDDDSEADRGNRGNRGDREDGDSDNNNRWQGGNRSFTMALKMEINFNNPGKSVEIVPPNGLDQYEEYEDNDDGDNEGNWQR